MKVRALVAQLTDAGLSSELISDWLNVCHPGQIERVLRDFAGVEISEQAKIGIRGARGLKQGIAAQRRETQINLARTQIELRNEEARKAINRSNQDMQALIDEFL